MRALMRFMLWTLLAVGAVVGMLRLTALRWWKVPNDPYLSASVAPTLRGGDWVLLWRLTPPGPGLLAMCPEPGHPERSIVGRIAGDPEDSVKVQGSSLFVRERRQGTEGDCSERRFKVVDPSTGDTVEQDCSMELAGGTRHPRGNAIKQTDKPDYEAKVPDDRFILISDNRAFPYDSRDYGPVPRETCKEIVFFRLIGHDGFGGTSRFTFIR